jgi:two-component system LytT family response regulator
MNTLKVAIIDDEPLALQRLRRLVTEQPDLQLVGEGKSGIEAVSLINSQRPDLIFLDVQMPELDGFGVLEVVGPENMPAVIFVTAFDEYAVSAFNANAVDFLLKPYDTSRFLTAVAKVRKAGGNGTAKVTSLADTVRRDRFVVRTDGRYIMLRPREVEFVEAAGNYLQLHVADKQFTVRETMSSLEARLDGQKFVRIHRSTLINLDHVKELVPTFHGEYVITLRSGYRVTLSRTYRSKLDLILGPRSANDAAAR